MKISKMAAMAASAAMVVGSFGATAASAQVAGHGHDHAEHKVLFKKGGTGPWSSGTFYIAGQEPRLRVTYSYSHNGDQYGPDNFAGWVESSTDAQLFVNDIARSGGKPTNLYPYVRYGNSRRYHVSIEGCATNARWHVKVVEVYGR